MRRFYIPVYILILFLFLKCSHCYDCPNYLTDYVDNYFPYNDGDTVCYINDIRGELIDTIKISYIPPDDEYCRGPLGGNEGTMECSGAIYMSIGDFYEYVDQAPNYQSNQVGFGQGYSNDELNRIGCMSCYYILDDTIDFIYYNSVLTAYNYTMNDVASSTGLDYCSGYIVSDDMRLLQYTIVIDDISYIWKLR